MKFLEKDLEDIICEAIKNEQLGKLDERGLDLPFGTYYRQFDFGGGYGVADIISVSLDEYDRRSKDKIFFINIIELKRDQIGYAALGQACRYVAACKKLAERMKKKFKGIAHIEYKITLIGRTLDLDSDFIYLADFIGRKVSLITYSFDAFDGIVFTERGGGEPTRPSSEFTDYEFSISAAKNMLISWMEQHWDMKEYFEKKNKQQNEAH